MDLRAGDSIKPMYNFILGCVHYPSEVGPVAFFKVSKKSMTFQKGKGPRRGGLKNKTWKERTLLQLAQIFTSNTVECHLHTTRGWKFRSSETERVMFIPALFLPCTGKGIISFLATSRLFPHPPTSKLL